MQIELKLQIDAIKGMWICYKEFGELIFISDGKIGVYLKERELRVDKSKMVELIENENSISFKPENLLHERTAAHETKIAHKMNSGFAIKLQSEESGEYCFVQEKYLKMFKGYNQLYIKTRETPVLIYRYGVPYGVIMPVFIKESEGE